MWKRAGISIISLGDSCTLTFGSLRSLGELLQASHPCLTLFTVLGIWFRFQANSRCPIRKAHVLQSHLLLGFSALILNLLFPRKSFSEHLLHAFYGSGTVTRYTQLHLPAKLLCKFYKFAMSKTVHNDNSFHLLNDFVMNTVLGGLHIWPLTHNNSIRETVPLFSRWGNWGPRPQNL